MNTCAPAPTSACTQSTQRTVAGYLANERFPRAIGRGYQPSRHVGGHGNTRVVQRESWPAPAPLLPVPAASVRNGRAR